MAKKRREAASEDGAKGLRAVVRKAQPAPRESEALDASGHERVRIVVSGGFTVEKIEQFERAGVPVDAYGVGSSLIRGSNDFTADIVMTGGKPSAKIGRHFRPSDRLEPVE